MLEAQNRVNELRRTLLKSHAAGETEIKEWPEWQPSLITPGLYQGGTKDPEYGNRFYGSKGHSISHRPDLVVTLYADAPAVGWEEEEVRYGFYDGPVRATDMARVVKIAETAYTRWSSGETILVRCQAGLNRSGLVTALILVMAGIEPKDAVALLRKKRSQHVLCNNHFENWLLRKEYLNFLAKNKEQ